MAFNRKAYITISNDDVSYNSDSDFGITSGSMNLVETLCESEFQLGSLCSNKFECEIFGFNTNVTDIAGMNICVTIIENSVNRVMFTGIIQSANSDRDKTYKSIVAYDAVYYNRDVNISKWWNEYWSEHTLASVSDIRTSLFDTMGMTFSTSAQLPNDAAQISQYTSQTGITFGTVVSMLAEVQGCFACVARDGTIKFIQLGTVATNVENRYESDTEFEEYTTASISGINMYLDATSLIKTVPTGASANNYVISGNIFLLGITDDSNLNTALLAIYNSISSIVYRPMTMQMLISDLSLELGDKITTNYGTHYIMEQVFSGILFIDQEIHCYAYGDKLNQNVTTKNNTIVEGQKYSAISQTLDGISAEVFDSATGESKITQISNNLTASIRDVATQVQESVEDVNAVNESVTQMKTTLEQQASKLEMTSERLETEFSTYKTDVDTTLADAEQRLQKVESGLNDELVSLLKTYIRQDASGITLGSLTSGVETSKLHIGTSGIWIYVNNLDEPVTNWTNTEFRAPTNVKIPVGGNLTLGKFKFIPRANGNMSLIWADMEDN